MKTTVIAKAIVVSLTVALTACSAATYEDARAESRKAGKMIEELTWNKNGLQIPYDERVSLERWWWRSANAVNQSCDAKDFDCVKRYYIELQKEMAAYKKKAIAKYGLKEKQEYKSPEKIGF